MTAAIRFEKLSIRAFRNLRAVELAPHAHLNLVVGDNGQGKTSLLEAMYVVATTRSFRTEHTSELVSHGADAAVVRAQLTDGDLPREQRAVIQPAAASFFFDAKPATRLAAYALKTPVVVFHPGDLELVSGPAALRRRLLDRVALFVDASSLDDRRRYTRALRSRQQVLRDRGIAAPELEAFEVLLGQHGACLTRARAAAAQRLSRFVGTAFARMAAPGLSFGIRYVPGGTADSEAFQRELAARRTLDARRQQATFGPQRDELEVTLDGRAARRHASQGQQRVLALALKVGELSAVEEATGAHPVLMLDDFSSELDASRTGAVYELLRETPSQVFVTTTRPELFSAMRRVPPDERCHELVNGELRTLP